MIYHALSVRQPYASQIASGQKKIEYRSWQTQYRGDLLIVSSARPVMSGLPGGQAICTIVLKDCHKTKKGYSWILSNPRPIKPFPVSGQLRIYLVECRNPLQFSGHQNTASVRAHSKL
jgi:hypothetical protein